MFSIRQSVTGFSSLDSSPGRSADSMREARRCRPRLAAGILFAWIALLILGASPVRAVEKAPPPMTPDKVPDQPITDTQGKLFEIAFESVSKMPLMPHHKDRARYQHNVVDQCFEVNQPQRALRYARRIENWRRGACLAEYVIYCRQRGANTGLVKLLNEADQAAINPGQQWRRDYVRVRIAKAYTLMGMEDRAKAYEDGVVEAETGIVDHARAQIADQKRFEELMTAVDRAIATKHYNVLINSLGTCMQLYDRFYKNQERRDKVADVVRLVLKDENLPIFNQIDIYLELTDVALKYHDRDTAKKWFKKTLAVFKFARWSPMDYIKTISRLARYKGVLGQPNQAREDLKKAMDIYNNKKHIRTISMIKRAGVLRAVAEAYQALGQTVEAMRIYRMAVEVGADNPNARVRAIDLSETCLSMALCDVEPDAKLWHRLNEINEGLRPPW